MRNALRSKAVDLSAVVVDLECPWSFGPPKGMTLLQQGADCYATLGENISTGGPLNCRSLRCASLRSG